MCGISGFLTSNTSLNYDLVLNNMIEKLNHRGPDAKGIWHSRDYGVGFAHARLSINDLSTYGSQPMLSNSKRYVICFNGEIYNFKDLALDLKNKGVKFKGHSDTEVLINGIEYYGPVEFVKKTYGMFAFSLWDNKKKDFYLFKDRLGQKPLYYSYANDSLIFASELKSIKEFPNWNNEICRKALSLYLRYSYVPSPYSIFKNTYKLLPGCYLKINYSKTKIKPVQLTLNPDSPETDSIKYYWNPNSLLKYQRNSKLNEDQHVNSFEKVLSSVIDQQLRADVPVGAFLSGGLDSSLIVALMSKLSSTKVNTFTIGMNEGEMNEAKFAKNIAKHLGTNHFEQYIKPNDCLDLISKMIYHFDEPFGDSSQLPTFFVSKLAKTKVSVSLSGDGGDELFGGYNRYNKAFEVFNKSLKIPHSIRKLGASVIQSLPPKYWDKSYSLLGGLSKNNNYSEFSSKLDKISKILRVKDPIDYYKSVTSVCENAENIVLSADSLTTQSDRLEFYNIHDPREKMMFLDTLGYLPDDILTKVDRASMAVSLEARVPFLDHRVLEFAWKLPMEYKINSKGSKFLIRKLLSKYVPEKLYDRPKMGFGIPIGDWIRNELKEWAEDLLSEKKLIEQKYFNSELVIKMWKDHLSGKKNNSHQLWNILIFQSWLKENKL